MRDSDKERGGQTSGSKQTAGGRARRWREQSSDPHVGLLKQGSFIVSVLVCLCDRCSGFQAAFDSTFVLVQLQADQLHSFNHHHMHRCIEALPVHVELGVAGRRAASTAGPYQRADNNWDMQRLDDNYDDEDLLGDVTSNSTSRVVVRRPTAAMLCIAGGW